MSGFLKVPRGLAPALGGAVEGAGEWPRGRVLMAARSIATGGELWTYLESRGFDVSREQDLGRAVRRIAAEKVDIVVIDGSFGADAILDTCPLFAGQACTALLLGKDGFELGVAALEAGADDWICAPHNPREILARLRALLRRRRRLPIVLPKRLTDRLALEGDGRLVAPEGASILPPIQHRLLAALCDHRGRVVTRGELIDLVYGETYEGGDRAVDVQVSRLRKRLAALGAPTLISCYRGVGYRLMG